MGGVLARQPLPRGGRVAVIGNVGGAGILAADACEAAGLQVPELSTTTQEALRTAIPGAASVSNPVDLGAGAGARDFAEALAAGLRSPDVDSVITVYARVPGTEAQAVADHIAGVTSDGDKPVLATFLAMDEAPDGGSIPSFAYPEAAARSLARVTAYARWRRRPVGTVPALEGIEEEAAHAMVEAELVQRPAGGWMDASQAAALLQTHGIAVAPTMAATTADEAVAAARKAFAGSWGHFSAAERGRVLARISAAVLADIDKLAQLETLDVGWFARDALPTPQGGRLGSIP